MTNVVDETVAETGEPVSQLRSMWLKLAESVSKIDEVLDADSASASKRKVGNDLVDEFKSSWTSVVDELTPQLAEMDERKRAGAFLGLVRNLEKAFGEDVNKYIQTLVDSQPKAEPVDKSLLEEASENRKILFGQMKSIRDLAISFNEIEVDDEGNVTDPSWTLPKVRRGGGPRGKRALTLFTWAIDGEGVSEDDDSVKGVSALLGFERSADFTAALREAGVNTTQPDDSFTVSIRGKSVTGSRITEEDDENGNDESDED